MATITYRSVKGAPLTNTEIDDNFGNLNAEVATKLASADYTASDVLTKIKTVDGTGSGLDADLLDGLNTSSSDTTGNSVVTRSGGNFSAGVITATLINAGLYVGTTQNITFEGSTDDLYETTLTVVDPTADRTITLPNVTGTVVTTGDTGTVTNTMLAGSIANAKLSNSSVTIDGNSVSLGGSISPGFGTVSGNNTWTGTQTFRDNKFVITDDTDTTKILALQVSNVPTSTTVTLTVPNTSGTIAIGQPVLTSSAVTFASQIISGNSQNNSLGVGTAASGTAGEIRATNNVTAFYTSDKNLKENIVTIANALQKIDQIRGVTFDWKDEVIKRRGGVDGFFVRKKDIGVIAQEIEAVVPEAVATNPEGNKAVRYELLIPLLIQSIKELKAEIETLKSK